MQRSYQHRRLVKSFTLLLVKLLKILWLLGCFSRILRNREVFSNLAVGLLQD
jgi:hypothetical protein